MRCRAALALVVMLLTAAADAAAIECQKAVPKSTKEYWSWRIIDGRQCWYVGRPGMDKSRLRWGNDNGNVATGRAVRDRPGDADAAVPAAPDVRPVVAYPVPAPVLAPAPPGDRFFAPPFEQQVPAAPAAPTAVAAAAEQDSTTAVADARAPRAVTDDSLVPPLAVTLLLTFGGVCFLAVAWRLSGGLSSFISERRRPWG